MALKKFGNWIGFNRSSVAALAATLAIVVLVTWWANHTFEERFRQELNHTLSAILDINHTAMDLWINEHARRVQFAAESPDIVAITKRLLALPRDRATLLTAQEEPRSKKLAWLFKIGGYQGYFIIAPDNISLSSARDANVGITNLLTTQPEMLKRIWAGEVVMSHPMISDVPLMNEKGEMEEGLPTMFVGAPIKDESGRIIAIFTLRIDPNKEFFPLLQAARISESGESYVFDRHGNMLSDSRFTGQLQELDLLPPGKSAVGRVQIKDPGIDLTQHNTPTRPLSERPLTQMAAAAATGKMGSNLKGYRDYRGVPVIGAWMWDPEMDFGMTVEQDVADAYQPLYMFRSLLYGFALFTAALLTGLMVLSAKGRMTMQKSQARLQGLIDTLIDGVVVIDERGSIESVNPAIERQFGYKAAELIGNNIKMLMPASDQQHHDSYLENFISTGKSRIIGRGRETLARPKNGREFPAEIAIGEMQLGDQRYFTGIIHDITQYKQAEEQLNMLNDELQMLAMVAQETDNAVIVTDKEGYILWTNRGFVTTSEYALEEVLGQRLGDLLQQGDGSDPQEIQNICSALHSGQKVTTELLTHSKSGRPYWINMEVSPVHGSNGELKQFIIIERDITALRRIMSELQQAKEAAEEASRSKSAFLAAMSHEIRTPMNGVIGMIDVLNRTEIDSHQHKLTATIRDSAFALLGIIDDILDFSKIEAGRLDLEEVPTNLCELMEGVGDTLQPLSEQKNVELILFCDPRIPTLNGDPIRLRQILFNLAGNAVKFSGSDTHTGRVTVRADLIEMIPEKNRAQLQIQVNDNGIGMSPEIQQRLFQPFSQAENSTTRRFGGTGLGLVICRRLVEMMNGTIDLQSEEGQGSIFTVHLDLELAPQQEKMTGQELANVTTLLVGFDDIARAIMACYLGYAGARVMIDASLEACAQRLNSSLANNDEQIILVDDRREQLGGPALYEQLISQIDTQSNAANIRLLVISSSTAASPATSNENVCYLRMNSLSRNQLIRTIGIALGRVARTSAADDQETIPIRAPITVSEARQRHQLILIAEDNKTNVKVILHQLELLGYAAEIANDGREALERWRNDNFALILTDCHMPEMDGYELTRAIRREEREGAHIPIIAITADALAGTQGLCLEAGMDDYLTKPTQIVTLHEKLAQWLPLQDETQEEGGALPEAEGAPQLHRHSGASQNDELFMRSPETATISVDTQTSELEVINPHMLSSAIGTDDHTTLASFYQDFLNTLNETITEIEQACTTGDYLAVGQLAHRLKSAASTTGATQLAACCLALEMAGKANDRTVIERELPLLRGQTGSVGRWIERYVAAD